MHPRILAAGLVSAWLVIHAPGAAALGAADACTWKGNFIASTAMTAPRAGAVATTLADGSVLVTGGSTRSLTVRTAERFDAATGTFTRLPDLTTDRYFHTSTRLPSGKVLIAGGSGGALSLGVTASAEIFDPATNTFAATGALTKARLFHTATPLSDGSVLIVGGIGPNGVRIGEVERYDPATGSFQVIATLATPRTNHAAAPVPSLTSASDEVLVVGGSSADGPTTSVEIVAFNAATKTATVRATASLAQARQDHTATRMRDGSVLVAGGTDPDYQQVAGVERWTGGTFQSAGVLHHPRSGHHAIALATGQVLVAGGYDIHVVPTAELYTPGGAFRDIGDLVTPRFYSAATLLPSGQVLFLGGFDVTEVTVLSGTELFDPFWAGIGPMTQRRRDHTATLLADGRVLLAGGSDGGSVTRGDADLFDPVAGTFTQIGMITPRAKHTATLLADGSVLLAGGQNATASFLGAAEVFRPAGHAFVAAPAMSTPRLGHAATLLADGRALVTGGFAAGNWSSTEAFTWNGGTAQGSFAAGPAMTRDRQGHSLVRLDNGHVLAIGGWSSAVSGISFAVEEFDPTTGSFAAWPNSQWLVTNRRDMVAVPIPGQARALVTGGLTSGYVPTAGVELIPQGGQGKMLSARFLHALAPTKTGATTFWAIGGSAGYSGPAIAAVDRLDAADLSTVTAMPELSAGRSRHTATLLNDGRVLVAGGYRDQDGATDTVEISKTTTCAVPPPHGFWPGRKVTFEKVYLRIGPQNFAIRALIGNGTRRNNPAFVLRYDLVGREGGDRRIAIGTQQVPKLGPGERSRLSASLPLPPLPKGTYDIQACVVPQKGLAGTCFPVAGSVKGAALPRATHFPRLVEPRK